MSKTYTVAELKKICKEKGIKGYSKMNKSQLMKQCTGSKTPAKKSPRMITPLKDLIKGYAKSKESDITFTKDELHKMKKLGDKLVGLEGSQRESGERNMKKYYSEIIMDKTHFPRLFSNKNRVQMDKLINLHVNMSDKYYDNMKYKQTAKDKKERTQYLKSSAKMSPQKLREDTPSKHSELNFTENELHNMKILESQLDDENLQSGVRKIGKYYTKILKNKKHFPRLFTDSNRLKMLMFVTDMPKEMMPANYYANLRYNQTKEDKKERTKMMKK